MMQADEPIEGPVTVSGHTWNIGDRVYFPCYSMGTITGLYRANHAALHCQIRAYALCDDGEMRTCCLDLQGQFLGYGDHKGSYLASNIDEREAYYKNKPKHPMPYEVGLMARKKRVENYTDEEYAESMDYETVTPARRVQPRPAPQSVTRPARSAAMAMPVARSVVTIGPDGSVIADHPGFAPSGKTWCKCQNCTTWFLSARLHTKTCSAKCRKALSRKGDQ